MDLRVFSPYVRLATLSELIAPCFIVERVLMDYELIPVSDGETTVRIDGTDHLCTRGTVILPRPESAPSTPAATRGMP